MKRLPLLIMLLLALFLISGCSVQEEKIVSQKIPEFCVVKYIEDDYCLINKLKCNFTKLQCTLAYENKIFSISVENIHKSRIDKKIGRTERVTPSRAILNNDIGYQDTIANVSLNMVNCFDPLLVSNFSKINRNNLLSRFKMLKEYEYDKIISLVNPNIQWAYYYFVSNSNNDYEIYSIKGVGEKQIAVKLPNENYLAFNYIGTMKKPYLIINFLCKPIVVIHALILICFAFMIYVVFFENK
jgi:hypothetical protein